jgi:deoxycytidylate deaminase
VNKWHRLCLKNAKEHTTHLRAKMCAVIVKGGSVLSVGLNSSTPLYAVFDPTAPEHYGMHAEVAALRQAPRDKVAGATIYVGGYNRSGNLIVSKPCNSCMEGIKESGISKVVFINNNYKPEFMRL